MAVSKLSHTLFALLVPMNPLCCLTGDNELHFPDQQGNGGCHQVISWSLSSARKGDSPQSLGLTERKGNLSTLSMPKALSCRMTGARLLRCISGTVDLGSFSKSSSVGGENNNWALSVTPILCSHHDRIIPISSLNYHIWILNRC